MFKRLPQPEQVNSVGFILILGSFDPQTKEILFKLKRGLSKEYGGSGIYPILLDETEAYKFGNLIVLEEKLSYKTVNLHVFSEDMLPIESYIYTGTLSLDNFEKFLKDRLDPELIYQNATPQKMNVIHKLDAFFEASFSILVIRHRHETRGGEIAELMYALVR